MQHLYWRLRSVLYHRRGIILIVALVLLIFAWLDKYPLKSSTITQPLERMEMEVLGGGATEYTGAGEEGSLSSEQLSEELLDEDTFNLTSTLHQLHFYKSRTDNARIVRIFDWAWMGSEWEAEINTSAVCLSVQSSLDRLESIPEVVEHWNGPTSLAVYLTSEEEYIALLILAAHFSKCVPAFNKASIQLALPMRQRSWSTRWKNPKLSEGEAEEYIQSVKKYPCTNIPSVTKEVLEKFSATPRAIANYPQNHLRNIAKKGCTTEWVFIADGDLVTTPNSAKELSRFLRSKEARKCEKCAYVIPTFELSEKKSFPSTKKQLVKFFRRGAARPFHLKVYEPAHKATNYQSWISSSLQEGPIHVSHPANKSLFRYYEPFYVSRTGIPDFHERFLGYGFTRSSQFQEALVEGWEFKVLTPIFCIHWKLQSARNRKDKRSKQREEETGVNRQIWNKLQKELKYRRSLNRDTS